MDQEKVLSQTASATRWSTVTEIVAKLVVPITNMLLARLLTPDAFGVVTTITMVISFAEMFADSGFQKYLIQHKFCNEKDLNDSTTVAFWTNLGISLAAWLLIILFREQIAYLVGSQGLGTAISVAAVSLPLTSFSSIQMARYKRKFDFKTLFYVRGVSVLLPLVVTVPLAYATRSFWSLIIGTIAGNLTSAIILTWKSEWKPHLYYSCTKLKHIFSYSWWILLESISIWLTANIDIFIVGTYLSTYYLGLYKVAMTTANQITGLVVAVTSAPLFSALSVLQNDDGAFKEIYCTYIQAISVFLLPLCVGIFLYKDVITLILLGNQWLDAINFIGLWGLSSSFYLLLGTYFSGVYNAKGRPCFSLMAQTSLFIVLIPVLLICAKKGFEMLYISRTLVRFEFVIVQLCIAKYFFDFPIIRLVRSIMPATLCTVVMSVFAYAALSLSSSFMWKVTSAVVCVPVYFVSMRIFYKEILYKAMNTFGYKFKLHIKRV